MTIIFVILTMIMYIKKKHVTMSNRLKALRARKGYNQTQLVKRAGIPRQTVFFNRAERIYTLDFDSS